MEFQQAKVNDACKLGTLIGRGNFPLSPVTTKWVHSTYTELEKNNRKIPYWYVLEFFFPAGYKLGHLFNYPKWQTLKNPKNIQDFFRATG